jgi:hypothetical protein
MKGLTLEELESGPTQHFSNIQSKAHKFKSKLEKIIIMKTHT